MKKLLSILTLTFFAFAAKAQVTFSPASFTAIDPVTLTVDVTGTAMAGESEAYIWIFSNPSVSGSTTFPNRDGSVNGSWGNSSDAAKLTNVGGNKWRFSFTGTELFGLTPAQLKDFGFLLKTKTGSKQTPDYKPFAFDPLIFTPTMLRVFPAKVGQDDVVTVVFDKSLATTLNDTRMTPAKAVITLEGVNASGTSFSATYEVTVRQMSTNMWGASFIPTRLHPLTAGQMLVKFKYKFDGTVLDTNGAPITVSGTSAEVNFSDLK